jgi:hypothetical protein
MPPAGFETTIPASERPQTYALGRAATGIGILLYNVLYSHICHLGQGDHQQSGYFFYIFL